MDSWPTAGGRRLTVVDRHRRALQGFTAAVQTVEEEGWARPTPCPAWDVRALVEHVIGFHEFLLLRPLGVRAQRPRAGALQRWWVTDTAIRAALADPAVLGSPAGYFDGATRRPIELLPALATDTLVHTWDLARAVRAPDRLDDDCCRLALGEASRPAGRPQPSAMFAGPVPVPDDAPVQDRLLGLLGRDPAWRPTGQEADGEEPAAGGGRR